MKSSPQEDGGNFIRPWGTLHFHLPLGGLKFFAFFFWGVESNKVFSTGGMGGVPPTLAKNSPIPPPPGKVLPSRFDSQKVHSPHTKTIFMSQPNKIFILSCSHCCAIFILPPYSFVHTGHANFDFNQRSIFTECCLQL